MVTSITRSHNDHWIVSGGRNGSIIMHSVDSSTPWQLLQSFSEEPKAVCTHRQLHSRMGGECDCEMLL